MRGTDLCERQRRETDEKKIIAQIMVFIQTNTFKNIKFWYFQKLIDGYQISKIC
jgi:hypothetical protein